MQGNGQLGIFTSGRSFSTYGKKWGEGRKYMINAYICVQKERWGTTFCLVEWDFGI